MLIAVGLFAFGAVVIWALDTLAKRTVALEREFEVERERVNFLAQDHIALTRKVMAQPETELIELTDAQVDRLARELIRISIVQ